SIDASAISAASFAHACGHLSPLELWVTDRYHDQTDCAMLSGGNLALDPGAKVARFELSVDDFAHDDASVAVLSVLDHAAGHQLAARTLKRHAFASTLLHDFDVAFTAEAGHRYDFAVKRVASAYAPTLSARAIYVRGTVHTPVTLAFDSVGIRAGAGPGALDD